MKISFGYLRKAQDGYNLSIPQYSPESTQEFTWVGHDLGPSVLALLKHYSDPVWEQRVLGRSFPIVTARVTYPELARRISAALGKPVVFTPIATSGAKDIDLLHALQSEFGMYMDTPVPNPDFVALGVQFGTLEEFIASEIVPRFG
ncbi:hypothetical protein B0H11DRAFT_2355563 [Mycena galericulata]|nr:hypothetical protein B0H11DRAFT_2355563 [Mycena galericulata]